EWWWRSSGRAERRRTCARNRLSFRSDVHSYRAPFALIAPRLLRTAGGLILFASTQGFLWGSLRLRVFVVKQGSGGGSYQLVLVLKLVQLPVNSLELEQFLVSSHFPNPPAMQHDDAIGVLYS